jgi:tRNA(Ser,Leu) C12 N-acetylase TAN1
MPRPACSGADGGVDRQVRVMDSFNVIVTAVPVPGDERKLLRALRGLGHFQRTAFRDVLLGQVADIGGFLEEVHRASEAGESWTRAMGRAIPVEHVFRFTTGTLVDQARPLLSGVLERMAGGTFYVRCERRGHADEISSHDVERTLADHLLALAEQRKKPLKVSFDDPDYIICIETIGDQCGVGLLGRDLRQRHRLVHVK